MIDQNISALIALNRARDTRNLEDWQVALDLALEFRDKNAKAKGRANRRLANWLVKNSLRGFFEARERMPRCCRK